MKLKNKPLTKDSSGFLLTGSIIAITIAFSPYLFYLYEIFPNGPVWETSLFTYTSLYYEDVLTAAWTYLGKIVPLLLLLIWFFTCKHWWYHTILIPAGMYTFQLLGTFYDDVYMETFIMDSNDLLVLAPFFILVLSLVYLIRIKIFDRVYGLDLSELEETSVSVFSNISEKDRQDLNRFQEEEDIFDENDSSNIILEEYYRKL